MSTEAQKRASEKYRLSHKDYYNKKSKEYAKKVRQDKDIYKTRIDKAIDFIKENANYCDICNMCYDDLLCGDADQLLDILQGEDNE